MKQSAMLSLQKLPETFDYIKRDNNSVAESIISEAGDRFMAISSSWQAGNYADIVEQANTLSLHCLCDIRVCIYYLYSLWVSQTEISTPAILNTLEHLLSHPQQPWKVTLILNKEEAINKVLANSVTMLFRKLQSHLSNPQFIKKVTQENPEQALQALQNLLDTLHIIIKKPGNELKNATLAIKNLYLSMAQEIQTTEPVVEEENGEENHVENNQHKIPPQHSEIVATDADLLMPALLIDPAVFRPSDALQQLFKRILLLQKLIDRQQTLKAAVVLVDIQQELDNFNPMQYFPEYFKPFALLRAQHAAELEPFFEGQQSYQWKVMHECYKTDMQSYLELADNSLQGATNTANRYDSYDE